MYEAELNTHPQTKYLLGSSIWAWPYDLTLWNRLNWPKNIAPVCMYVHIITCYSCMYVGSLIGIFSSSFWMMHALPINIYKNWRYMCPKIKYRETILWLIYVLWKQQHLQMYRNMECAYWKKTRPLIPPYWVVRTQQLILNPNSSFSERINLF
jgi:hypothetical protein